ncbi:MAG: bifunctional fucokinase/fucose-1-phosphate guanylyltransferase [Prolixibacteraceae bacterium]
MKKYLLSIPSSLIGSFYGLTGKSAATWMVDCDPGDARVGSGGGTAWMLYRAWQQEQAGMGFGSWLAEGKRVVLHAGGQSRRLPAYAPVGKILTPVPVFRWQRGQRLDQTLLDMQVPLYDRILQQAPGQIHTLVASGDVLITGDELPVFPEADVICFGLWISPEQSTHHGVFFCDRHRPDSLEFMLQKPSVETIRGLAPDYYFMMDIGIWLLSDRAVELLMARCGWDGGRFGPGVNWSKDRLDGVPGYYDLYSDFGPAMGLNPQVDDPEIRALRVKIVSLEGGAFYHFGTGSDMLQSMLQIQNRVLDQRAIWNRNVKPHPSIFVQNAITGPFQEYHRQIWIENSCIPTSWRLASRHILTGIPKNSWTIDLKEGICLDMIPVAGKVCLRPYGFTDSFSGTTGCPDTLWMEKPLMKWMDDRRIESAIPDGTDIQQAPLFPLLDVSEDFEHWIRWMTGNPQVNKSLREEWLAAERLSAAQISSRADLPALQEQRQHFRALSLGKLAGNYRKSVFYQLDLDHTAREWARVGLELPQLLPASESPLLQIHNRMFRNRIGRYRGDSNNEDETAAFRILQEAILQRFISEPVLPRMNVMSDQIVWGRSPARLDLAGGWTDTPPYCLIEGGRVVNVAVEMNGQPPLQVFVKPAEKHSIILRSIDLGEREEISTWEHLALSGGVGSAFAIPKAALILTGFHPDYCRVKYHSMEEQLRDFGGGMEITLLSAIPKGSGLGTSSILAATILGTLSDFASLKWDRTTIGNRTLALEQLLTTGGGWQDQFGGLLPGVKYLESVPGINQSPTVRWLPDHLFTRPECLESMLLYYTGITRVAKNILAEIVRGMFLNSDKHLGLLREMKGHALNTFEAIQTDDYGLLAAKIRQSWQLNCELDEGTNPPQVASVIRQFEDYAAAYKLLGAGGGGYLLILAKNPEAAGRIRSVLQHDPPNMRARFVDLSLSGHGFQVTRS